jgi:hypothetical protein
VRLVDANGQVVRATRFASGQPSVRDSDVTDPSRLADIIRAMSVRITELEAKSGPEGTEFEVDASSGSQVRLYHGFKSPVRYHVVRWKDPVAEPMPAFVEGHAFSIITRASAIVGGPLNAGGNIVAGVRHRITTTRPVIGVRFFWANSALGAYTVRARVWNDTTGVSLAQKDIQVQLSGVYEAIFDSPIATDLTGFNTTFTVRELTGTRFTYINGDASTWNNLSLGAGIVVAPTHRVLTVNLTGAGDVRPISTASAHSFPVEPIFAPLNSAHAGPHFDVSQDSNGSELVLNCHATGRAVIRIEPAQAGLVNE